MQTLNLSPTGREVSGAHKLSEVGVLIGFNFLPGGQKVKLYFVMRLASPHLSIL